MLPTEMGQPHKHMDLHSVLKTEEKHGCYINNSPDPCWEITIPDVVESEFLRAMGGQFRKHIHITVGLIVSSCKLSVQHVTT